MDVSPASVISVDASPNQLVLLVLMRLSSYSIVSVDVPPASVVSMGAPPAGVISVDAPQASVVVWKRHQ